MIIKETICDTTPVYTGGICVLFLLTHLYCEQLHFNIRMVMIKLSADTSLSTKKVIRTY